VPDGIFQAASGGVQAGGRGGRRAVQEQPGGEKLSIRNCERDDLLAPSPDAVRSCQQNPLEKPEAAPGARRGMEGFVLPGAGLVSRSTETPPGASGLEIARVRQSRAVGDVGPVGCMQALVSCPGSPSRES